MRGSHELSRESVLSEPAAMPRFAETSAREGLMLIINLRGDAFAKLLTGC